MSATMVEFVGCGAPDQPRDDHGRWTDGGASASFNVPEAFTLQDAQYDVGTRFPLDAMVVASVDLELLHSEYGNDSRVQDMTRALKQGAKFPPLTLEQRADGKLGILDGRTRIAALREAGIKGKVPAVVRLDDVGTEASLPKGVVVDSERTASLRGSKRNLEFLGAESPSRYRLSKFASAHAAELVDAPKKVRDAIRGEVRKALKNGEGPDGIADRLFEVVDMTPGEIQRIAETEYVIARTGATLEKLDADGAAAKGWVLGQGEEGCAICQALDGQVVALDEPFVLDGEEFDGPPAHPNCHCDVEEADAVLVKAAVQFVGAEFDESKHPRDEHGKWTGGGGAEAADSLDEGGYIALKHFMTPVTTNVAGLVDAKVEADQGAKQAFDLSKPLKTEQDVVGTDKVKSIIKKWDRVLEESELPRAARNKDTGELTLTDGNHRVVAAKLRGDKTINVHVVTLPGSKFK